MAGLINSTTKKTSGGLINASRSVGSLAPKADLSNSGGLYNLAVQSGLQGDADRIRAKNQGESRQIFSGGVISDLFDGLNALDYGVVGLLKGKGFAEGVKSRQSFSDKDALGNFGITGTVLGTVLDIAVDPLTYIPPLAIAKRIPLVSKLAKAGKTAIFGEKVIKTVAETGKAFETVEGGTKIGKYLADKFAYGFGKDPQYMKLLDRSVGNIGNFNTALKKLTQGVIDLPKEKLGQLLSKDKTGRFIRKPLEALTGFSNKELETVADAYKFLDNLGEEAVRVGLLKKGTFEENVGQYLKSAYEEYELSKKAGIFGSLKNKVMGIKARKDLTPEAMKALGQIDNPGYLLWKSSFDLIKDIENTKFFNEVGEKFGSKVSQEGFELVKQGQKTLGSLAGKYVPKAIHSDLTALTVQAGEIEKIMRPVTSTFKFMKVVMNPASNVRNIISNKLLNNFDEAGMPLWRLDKDMQGWKSALTKDKWYQEVEKLGGAVDTFTAQELEGLLDPKVFSSGMRNGLNKAKEFFSGIYQREEMSAKMSMYIYQRTTKKLGEEEAWKIAERATFNYAQVTPFIRKLRSNFFGFPFITFTVKSTPVIAKVIATKPTKLSNIGKIRNAIENMADIKETERERAAEPSWVKNGFYVKLPMKDKHGRSAYFDLTYILPFGDLVNLGDETQMNIFSKSPGLNLIKEIGSNQDFFKNKIWRESDSQEKKLGDLMRHLSKTFLPPPIADQIPGGYKESTGERISGRLQQTTEASSEDQKRTLMQEMLRNVGLKVQPLDADIQETYQEWNLKRDLEELLNEKGVTKEFTRTYIPN